MWMLIATAVTANGDFHLGAGIGWSVPLNSVPEQRQLPAVTVDLTWEWQRAFVGFTLLNAPGLRVNPWPSELPAGTPWDAAVVHAAYMPWTTPLASFYIGGGAGLMFVAFRKTDVELSPSSVLFHFDSGGALMGEAGFLFFRGARWGRVSAAAQVFVPTFSVSPEAAPGRRSTPMLLLGVRAQL